MSPELHWTGGPVTDAGRDVIALMRAELAGDEDAIEAILAGADLRAVTRTLLGTITGAMAQANGPAGLDAQLASLQEQAAAEAAGGGWAA